MNLRQAPDFLPDNPLAALLQNKPLRQRCIRRIAEHLPRIQQAREMGHTWDAIADALNINRGTLINAVKTLTVQPTTYRARATPSQPVALSMPPPTSPRPNADLTHDRSTQDSPMTTDAAPANQTGIIPLGRTRIKNFNL